MRNVNENVEISEGQGNLHSCIVERVISVDRAVGYDALWRFELNQQSCQKVNGSYRVSVSHFLAESVLS